jgi:dienelactone hydrolase
MTAPGTHRPTSSGWLYHIPLIWLTPEDPSHKLAIWIPSAGGAKEDTLPYLQELAAAGFVAVSYDPWQHGARYVGTETLEQRFASAKANYYYHVWPMVGQSALESLRVIDWAIASFGIEPPCYIGGISLGGYIAVAAAGLDPRIGCVGGIVCTPDWRVPGLHWDGQLLPLGKPDAYAQFFFDRINPLTHPSHYAHCPAMTFECGELDDHLPPDGAVRFREALRDTYREHPDRLRVNLHPGVGHQSTPAMWQNCLSWFAHH